jgi:hypothetical protein
MVAMFICRKSSSTSLASEYSEKKPFDEEEVELVIPVRI